MVVKTTQFTSSSLDLSINQYTPVFLNVQSLSFSSRDKLFLSRKRHGRIRSDFITNSHLIWSGSVNVLKNSVTVRYHYGLNCIIVWSRVSGEQTIVSSFGIVI